MFGLPVPIIGLIVAVAVLVYLVLRTRVHAFIAMLIASAIAGNRALWRGRLRTGHRQHGGCAGCGGYLNTNQRQPVFQHVG